MQSRVLVVATLTVVSNDLLDALRARAARSPAAFHLLMPASEPGIAGRAAQQSVLERALARWHKVGLQADGEVGDNNPATAVAEAWDPRHFDEVIVSTLPGATSKWMRADLPHRVARITDCQVTHVVSRLPPADHRPYRREARAGADPGLLAVVSWGRWSR